MVRVVHPEDHLLQPDLVAHLDLGPVVGEAYRFLLEMRLDEGPLGAEEAERRLRAWWQERDGAS